MAFILCLPHKKEKWSSEHHEFLFNRVIHMNWVSLGHITFQITENSQIILFLERSNKFLQVEAFYMIIY